MKDLVRDLGKATAGLSLIAIVFGLLLLFFPGASSKFVCYLLAGIILICGVFCILRYFFNKNADLLYRTDVFIGLILCAIAVFMFFKSELIISLLVYVVGICVLVDGFFKVQKALELRKFNITSWWVTLLLAVITVALGIFMLFYPFATAKAIVSVIGICLLYEGVVTLWTVFWLHKAGK